MSTTDKSSVQSQTEASKKEAMNEAHQNENREPQKEETIHTINPFTGTQIEITQEDIDGMEKLNEANTERD